MSMQAFTHHWEVCVGALQSTAGEIHRDLGLWKNTPYTRLLLDVIGETCKPVLEKTPVAYSCFPLQNREF